MLRQLLSLLLSGVLWRRDYWQYVLKPRNGYGRFRVPWHTVVWCRMNCHPSGVNWHTSEGDDPDWRCKVCNDNLG